MTIAPISYSAGWLRGIGETRQQMIDLQRQLTTGKKAELYSGLGSGIDTAVAMRARLDRLGAYQSSGQLLAARMDTMETVLSRYDALTREARNAVAGTMPLSDLPNPLTLQQQARSSLDEAVSLLNTDVGGRYLFAGRATATEPVTEASRMLDGDPPKAGFATVAKERLQADLGTDGLGRLDLGATGGTVTLAEDAAGSPFGFKLDAVTSGLGGDTVVTGPTGDPATLDVAFGAVPPAAGETLTLKLGLPDGTSKTLTFTAVAANATEAGAGTFRLGADADATAANLRAAMQEAVSWSAKTDLAAASSFAAANDFFDNNPPLRVDPAGGPLGEATAVRSGAADTVIWYHGGDYVSDGSITDPEAIDAERSRQARNSAVAAVADDLSVGYGAQANESDLRASVKNLAVISVAQYDLPGKEGEALYSVKSNKLVGNLKAAATSVSEVRARTASQRVIVDKASERNDLEKATAQDLLGSVEDADINEVAVGLLQLQTQLQASYQVTSMLSKLSLVNLL